MALESRPNGQSSLYTGQGWPPLVSLSPKMKELCDLVMRLAAALADLLLEGESGTGKELVARALQAHSPRRAGPFVSLNSATIPDALLESELFGHAAGAFSGAGREKAGLLEAAHGGTLVLDEVSEMSAIMQVKLLRFLSTREFYRVGETFPRKVDVAIIAVTNKDLAELTLEGSFRQDLYFRLKRAPIRVPALRERPEDILPLAELFLSERSGFVGRTILHLMPAAKALLLGHEWPGNVRELENCMDSMVRTLSGDVITPEDLRTYLGEALPMVTAPGERAAILKSSRREEGEASLKKHKGNQSAAARELGIARSTLRKWMKR